MQSAGSVRQEVDSRQMICTWRTMICNLARIELYLNCMLARIECL